MTDSAETMRTHKYVTLNADGDIWTAGIDIRKNNGDWHYNAVECHSVDRELAIARRDTVFAALSASGPKSDGGAEVASSASPATRGEQRDRTHGTMPVGGNAENSARTDRSPSDPIPSQPDEREAIARIICCGGPCKMHDQKNCDALYFFGDNAAAILAILAVQAERRAFEVSGKYNGIIKWSDEDQAFIPEFPGCMSDVTTRTELADAQEAWLGACLAAGNKVPEPQKLNETSQPAPIAGLEPVAWQGLDADGMWVDCSYDGAETIGEYQALREVFTRAQLEAHAAEQVRAEREVLLNCMVEIRGIGGRSADYLNGFEDGVKAKDAAIRARGQV